MRWKILISSLLLFANLPAVGQDRAERIEANQRRYEMLKAQRLAKKHAREERYHIEGKEDYIFGTVGVGMVGLEQGWGGLPFMVGVSGKVEYSRQIKGKFFVGGTYTFILHDEFSEDLHKLSGMAYFRFPVVSNRLYFRLGAGVGAGLYGDQNVFVRPYIDFEAAWILRLSRHVEMKLRPIPVSIFPSEISISPMHSTFPMLLNMGVGISVGGRF